MKIISWNIRGCSSQLKNRILRRKIGAKKPEVFFLQVTKIGEEELRRIGEKVWIGCKVMGIDAEGSVGGIGILWNLDKFKIIGFMSM